MEPRKLGILALILIVLGLVAYWVSRPPSEVQVEGVQPGDEILAGLDLNEVEQITISAPGGTGSLVRKEGEWIVAGLYDYPADFSRLRDRMQDLEELKVGQVARGAADALDEFGLGTNATTLVLADGQGKELASLLIGDERETKSSGPYGGNYPDGQYVRAGEGPVLLVAKTLSGLNPEGADWIKKQLLEVDSSDVIRITVTSTNSAYVIDTEGDYAMDGLTEEEELNRSNVDRLRRALQYLSCVTVADPALSDEELGFDTPASYAAATQDGFTYRATLGTTTDDGRYARFSIRYAEPPEVERAEAESQVPEDKPAEPPAEGEAVEAGEEQAAPPEKSREERIQEKLEELRKERQGKIDEAQEKLAELKDLENWTYVISTYNAESMALAREQVVDHTEKDDVDESDAPAIDEPPAAGDAEVTVPAGATTEVAEDGTITVTTPPIPVPPIQPAAEEAAETAEEASPDGETTPAAADDQPVSVTDTNAAPPAAE